MAKAQETAFVGGSVRDGFLKAPLPDAKVELLSADSIVVDDSVRVIPIMNSNTGKVAFAQFYLCLPLSTKYLLHATLDGYEDGWLSFETPQTAQSTKDIGELELRKIKSAQLNEVTVTATKIKMYWRGDTIVYNADAFNLPEGSMLDDLVRQMPGVTINENAEIFVNGRKVDELLLGSRSFFRGNKKVLLENLPYYSVKNIKVYDKQSDASKALGIDVDPRQYVMDVNLKPEYNRGAICNVESATGSNDRYLARGFLLGFSDLFRYTLLGNVNNVNESRHIGKTDYWTPASAPISMITTRSVAGEMNFRNEKVEETLTVDYSSTTNNLDMQQRNELFLEKCTPLSIQSSADVSKARTIKFRNLFILLSPRYLHIDMDYSHSTHSGHSSAFYEEWNDTLTNRYSQVGMVNGSSWNAKGYLSGYLDFGKKKRDYINYNLGIEHSKEENEQWHRYSFDVPMSYNQYNLNDYSNKETKMETAVGYGWYTSRKLWFLAEGNFNANNQQTHDWLYHPDTLLLPSQRDLLMAITDYGNSYSSHYKKMNPGVQFVIRKTDVLSPGAIPLPIDYSIWELVLTGVSRWQSIDYQRGSLDTLATRTELVTYQSFTLRIFPHKKYNKEITFQEKHIMDASSLLDRISYRDDSQPLIVKLGNPHIKGNQKTSLKADYYSRELHQYFFHVNASFLYLHRATAQSVRYNSNTGVYTYCPENVHGNYDASLSSEITRTMGKENRWNYKEQADASYKHSIDYTMMNGDVESYKNTVNTLTVHDNISLQYSSKPVDIILTGDFRWRHSKGRMLDFNSLSALDFQYGLSARYTVPLFKTTISADVNMYSRRGYGNSTLNTNDLVCNASVSQPLYKNKLVVRMEAFDLFHQLSNTRYEVNAQGRTETYYRSLPHYAMIHLVYQWGINKNK
jgi:hypothetical protein